MDKHYAASVQVPLILPYMDDNEVSSFARLKKKKEKEEEDTIRLPLLTTELSYVISCIPINLSYSSYVEEIRKAQFSRNFQEEENKHKKLSSLQSAVNKHTLLGTGDSR